MTGRLLKFKIQPKDLISPLIALSYVAISCYLIIFHEYYNGEFNYYFYKSPLEEIFSQKFNDLFAKIWYGNVNKIIFPISFWLFTGFIFLAHHLVNKSSITLEKVLLTFRYTLIFHFYILLATYVTEITPGFIIMPGTVPPIDIIAWYRTFFVEFVLTGYYLFWLFEIDNLINKLGEWYRFSIVFSPIILFFLPFDTSHLYSFVIACIFAGGLALNRKRVKFHWPFKISLSTIAIIIISALGVFFRLKYAQFFTATGDQLLIFNADGEAYYTSAKKFFVGNIADINFVQTPYYSFYLYFFFEILGPKLSSLFYGQALVGATVPLIIYSILARFKYPFAGLIAAIFIATDPLCIHYSVSVNRSSPQLVTLPLIILLCIHLEKKISAAKVLFFGSCVAATFYMGPETLPILLGIGGYVMYLFFKQHLSLIEKWKTIAFFLIGISIISIPINAIYYKSFGKWILLGRDSQASHASTFVYKNNETTKKFVELGFNPIEDPQNSLKIFLQQPITIFNLIVEKLFTEIPGFLFDPEAVYLAPIHLSMESFYGAHVQFYIYFFLLIGGIYFISNPQIAFRYKALILGPIICQAIMTSIVIFGTNRFRAPITPLNFILVGFGIWAVLFFKFQLSDSKKNLKPLNAQNIFSFDNLNKFKYLFTFIFFVLIGLISPSFKTNKIIPYGNYQISNWMRDKGEKLPMGETYNLKLNSGVVAFVENKENENKQKFKVSFPVCNYLIPNQRNFVVFATSEKIIGKPRIVTRGCSIIETEVYFYNKIEAFYFYFYASKDGFLELENPKTVTAFFKGNEIQTPFYQKFKIKKPKKFSKTDFYYQNYSNGGLIIGRPEIE